MTVPLQAAPRLTVGRFFSLSLRNYSAVWLGVVFVTLFSITATQTFPTTLTLKIVLTNQVTVGLLALALLIPLCAETFDLSVGAMLAFSMIITSTLASNGYDIMVAALIALACCAVVGAINGFIVVKLHINSFIATLGTSQLLLAATLYISKNQQIIPPLPSWFTGITANSFLGLNYDVYVLFAVAIALWYLLEHTPIGRSLFATGGNHEAARLAGVHTNRLTWGAMVVSALIAGLAGVLFLSKSGMYSQEFGAGFLFPAFAAVFFGATQVKGRPNVWGTILALYVLAAAVAGLQLTFFGNEYWIDPLFNGAALIIAVALASRKQLGRTYRKMRKGKGDGTPLGDAPGESATEGWEAVPAAREPGS